MQDVHALLFLLSLVQHCKSLMYYAMLQENPCLLLGSQKQKKHVDVMRANASLPGKVLLRFKCMYSGACNALHGWNLNGQPLNQLPDGTPCELQPLGHDC